ncbi:MAG: gliding motility lipoprotein GldD [Flavobacteriaceae bacterium]
MKRNLFLLLILLIICTSCSNDYIPKPKAYLRLDYPQAQYTPSNLPLPLTFETNILAQRINVKEINATAKSYGITIDYPALKGTIFLTYKAVNNNKEILNEYLRDAQKFTQEHTRKADVIIDQLYDNPNKKVYGMFYEVGGNAASQSQFYVTDSVRHFLTGSLYFRAKPNYDSIYPAAKYLENDIRRIMESIEWK